MNEFTNEELLLAKKVSRRLQGQVAIIGDVVRKNKASHYGCEGIVMGFHTQIEEFIRIRITKPPTNNKPYAMQIDQELWVSLREIELIG